MTAPINLPNSVEIIDQHLHRFFDTDEMLVFHEKESTVVHSDVFLVKANEERNFNLLMTCGMSALPMNVPEEIDNLKYAEIAMLLPADWPLSYKKLRDENNYWPIRTLLQLSKYPHINDTWFGFGHSIPMDHTQKVNHKFHKILLAKSTILSEGLTYVNAEDKEIHIYCAIPLYKEELDCKIKHGAEKLLELFWQFGIDEIVDINRKNVCEYGY